MSILDFLSRRNKNPTVIHEMNNDTIEDTPENTPPPVNIKSEKDEVVEDRREILIFKVYLSDNIDVTFKKTIINGEGADEYDNLVHMCQDDTSEIFLKIEYDRGITFIRKSSIVMVDLRRNMEG